MISKYIKELIENNNRIIIPDFGAFMIQDSPKGKQISFNDFLKFNDGLLVNQIIKSEKISKNQATEQIKAFIKSIEESFAQKKPFHLEGIGYLVKDNHGNIKFQEKPGAEAPKTEVKTEKPADSKPTIVLDEKKKEEKTGETKKEEPANKKPAAAPADKKPTPPPPSTPADSRPAEPNKKTTPPTTGAKPGIGKPSTGARPKQTASAATSATKKKTYTTSGPSNENTTRIILIIAAIVVVLGGGTWAFLHFNVIDMFKKQPKETTLSQPVVTDTIPEVDTTAQAMNTTETETETEVEEPLVVEEPEEKTDPNQKKYYIIAGSFKIPANAENFNQKLTSQGYDSDIIPRTNGFHAVSYKKVYSWNEALAEWRNMRNTDEQTWILIK